MKDRAEPFDLASLAHAPTGMPKYLQLRNSLAAAIADGRWQAGARFPTEDRLTEATGLSLGTVQKALKSLADEGLVARRQGTGTFVAKAESPMNAPFYHCRFLGDDGELLPIYSKFVGRHAVTDKGEWSRHFEAREVTCIERIFSINGISKPMPKVMILLISFPWLAPILFCRPSRTILGR